MEPRFNSKSRFNKMKKAVMGLLLALAGVLLLGFNFGALPIEYKDIIFSWPMLLIALGLINISSKESSFLGAMLLAVGGFFITPRLFIFDFDFAQVAWPALLIIAGVLIIFKKSFPKKHRCDHFQPSTHEKSYEKSYEKGKINETNVFGGSRVVFDNEEFKGGEINNVFGGAEIDLSGATLAEGENFLEINCVFGGVKLIVPQGWNIKLRMDSVMGGFHDKRKTYGNIDELNRNKILIIKGAAIFGGGEIKTN